MLLKELNRSGKVHMVPASLKGKYVIRFTVTSMYTTENDIEQDWNRIQQMAMVIMNRFDEDVEQEAEVEEEEEEPAQEQQTDRLTTVSPLGLIRRQSMANNKEFGMSLILSNVPRSPKVINGSFAALFDTNIIIERYARHIEQSSVDFNGRPIRLSPRKRMKDHSKQYSLDLNMELPAKPSRYRFKQGSLDSKIDEIFDSSFDSDACDTETESNGNGYITPLQESQKSIVKYTTADKNTSSSKSNNKDTYANGWEQ